MKSYFRQITILISIVLLSTTLKAQNPLGAATLGVGLDVFANKIHEAIERATGAGLILEVNAGGEVAQAIDQMKQAYEKELNKTWADLGAQEQLALNSLNSTVNSLVDKTYIKITDIEDQAQGILHIVPLSKNLPIVTKSSPVYISQTTTQPKIILTLKGDFYDMARNDYEAISTMNGKQYKNVTNNENQITFEIPLADFKKDANSMTANYITIQIPYQKSPLLFFKKKEIAVFKIALGCLPNSPGTLNITTMTNSPGLDVQHKSIGVYNGDGSYEFRQESGDDDIKCGGEHADLAIHKCYPDGGYRVRPNTVKPNILWSQGKQGKDEDWWLESNCSTTSEACLCFSTEHHGPGTSGKIHFRIEFDEEKDIMVANHVPNDIPLTWTMSKTFDVPTGATWKARYVQFDGTIIEFSSPLTNNPYLSVTSNPSSTGQIITIATKQ